MTIVDKNALEICLQVGGERFGKRVFPSLQVDFPVKSAYVHRKPDYLYNILVDSIKDSLQQSDPAKNKKHGSLLSGGVDSSLLTWLLNDHEINLECYTNSFVRDESEHAEFFVDYLKLPFHLISALAEDQAKIFKKSTSVFLPLPALPHVYMMFDAMKKRGVEIAWSGLGVDELFGGYTIHKRYYNQSSLSFLPAWFSFSSKWRRALTHLFGTEDARFKDWTMPFRKTKFVKNSSVNYNDIYPSIHGTLWSQIFDWNMDALIHNYVEHTRQIAAYFGIQVMFPFLYRPLVAYGYSLEPEQAYNKKYIRRLMRKMGIPERICSRGEKWDKMGWGDTMNNLWSSDDYRNVVIKSVESYDSGFLNRKWYEKNINKPQAWQKRIFIQMALFELMCKQKGINNE